MKRCHKKTRYCLSDTAKNRVQSLIETNSEIRKRTSYNTKPEHKNSSDHEVFGSILSSFSNETRETLATDNINRVVTKYSSKITQRQLSVEK